LLALRTSAVWRAITGDSHDVYVEPFHSYRRSSDPGQLEGALGEDFRRVFRYMLKFAALPEPVRWQAFTSLTSRNGRLPRLLSSSGTLYGQHLPDEPAEGYRSNHRYEWADGAYELSCSTPLGGSTIGGDGAACSEGAGHAVTE
jgi:hypothetical protein